ncbi:ImmA/IrrE family metallo-endopeptidase [Muricauda sp. MAR_2010_75]|uniref:ImmA/IrrE family metallo-endopeptidase n=1 Tax=Allomuricauda sp. MAR_2010_75 TaxID=1250232 RepID=UPI000565E0EA|nr:ImmA/IrrE family metallo-endopeptidase [Muricauda sp. MAR_2010_75]
MKTNNKGKNKAIEVLQEIGFDEVTELSNSELISGFGIIYISEPLDNADGKIIRGKKRTIIKVNSSIPYPGRIRYVAAHELGHYFLHDKLEIHTDNSKTLNWFKIEKQAKRGLQEFEANDFASELLMPEKLFRQFVLNKSFTPSLIKEISTRFQTSLTSVIYRLISLDIAPILVVFMTDGVVRYWRKSTDLRGWVKDITKLSPPDDSVAKEYIDANYEFIYKGEEKAQEISRSTWFQLHENQEDSDFLEYCIPTKQYKTIISVIWEA